MSFMRALVGATLLAAFAVGCSATYVDPSALSNRTTQGSDLADGSDLGPNQGTSNGNTILIGSDTDGDLSSSDAQGTVFTFDQAWINLRRLTVRLPRGVECNDVDVSAPATCESSSGTHRLRLKQQLPVDLLMNTEISAFTLPQGVYHAARAGVARTSAQTAPDLLDGFSVAASGRFDYQGANLTFSLQANARMNLPFYSREGIEITEDRDLLLKVDAGTWFNTLDITKCIEEGKLPIVNGNVDLSGNFSCYRKSLLKFRLRQSTELTID